jgi:ABC-type glycerol-3-phosphate transport system substrate-binding protein
MGEVTPMMPPATWTALERLLEVARADTHQARYVANFLLAWWNAGDLGGFDLTETWGLDDNLREDLVTLFGFIARNKTYPSAYSFRSEFEDLVRQWRPQVLSREA